MEKVFEEFSAGLRAMAPVTARLAAEDLAVSIVEFNSLTGKIDCVILNSPAPWMNKIEGRGISQVDGKPWLLASGVFDGVIYKCFLHPGEKGYEIVAAMDEEAE